MLIYIRLFPIWFSTLRGISTKRNTTTIVRRSTEDLRVNSSVQLTN